MTDLANRLEALRQRISDNDPAEPIANGLTVWDSIKHDAAYILPQAIKALYGSKRVYWIDIIREWFGGERYARDYEYLNENYGKQAKRVANYLAALEREPDEARWRPISELDDIYQQPIQIASPKLIHGECNPLGISPAYWQDTDGAGQGEWRCVGFDIHNDEFTTLALAKKDVTHFMIPTSPWTDADRKLLENISRGDGAAMKGGSDD